MGNSWSDENDPNEPGMGEVVEDPMPIGDTPWLFMLILAVGYLAFRYRKKSALIFSF